MWTQAGWARITFHRDGKDPIFEGAFRVDGDHHHIHSLKDYRRTKLHLDPDVEIGSQDPKDVMVLWKDSSIIADASGHELRRDLSVNGCGADALRPNSEFDPLNIDNYHEETSLHSLSARFIFGRQMDNGQTGNNGAGVNLVNSIGSTTGCFSSRRVALIGIATDCMYHQQFENESDMRTNVIRQINSASAIYESRFNISLGIQNLTVTESSCPTTTNPSVPWNVPCSSSVDISTRLNQFSAWRGQFIDTNAFWSLLTTCNTGTAVGLAWLGQVCLSGSTSNGGSNETVASTNVIVRTSTEWQVMAHEIGHTFGAVHDCTADACAQNLDETSRCCPLSSSTCDAGGAYIMSPSTGSGITEFSPCSIGNICSAIGRSAVKTDCLTNNRNVPTITGAQCGNGIVETGEDCDCGGETGCGGNSCCDPNTCRFTTNSECDPSNEDCCTDDCRLASSGTVCRPSTGPCDPEEVCNGTIATCPPNVFSDDGTSCGTDLRCASGQCTSRDQQCKAMMGSSTNTNSNDTRSCGQSNSCQMQCTSPRLRSGVCVQFAQTYLDGTPCGSGGLCRNGACNGQSMTRELRNFFQRNKHILIPVIASVGGLIVLMFIWSLCTSIRRRRRIAASRRMANNHGHSMPMSQMAIHPHPAPMAYSSSGAVVPQYMPAVRYG
ncbi:Disintegrin and metalloproteinase domain-containing protein B [Ceratocystis fimbriata CBS 114723]|uniref:Disintegrin and metalloproteinase domain-containing protein B n=1 Tax=Ceratocystis fimbriata CBS 114723 TaxID=1035309 RepID=A0A2C5XIU6_9PEZI|nr:Disintegrin and metalloproteinase domain-containing protein B [Ceratocystis fimbriata CBS 114723]